MGEGRKAHEYHGRALPLANGASLDGNFLLGTQQTGTFRFLLIDEALP